MTRRDALAAAAATIAVVTSGTEVLAAEAANTRHTLWYTTPAGAWTEALPVGNGRIGAMVFGGIATERLQLNEGSLWAGGPYDAVNPEARINLPELRRLIFAGRYAQAEAFANAHVMAQPLKQAAYQPLGNLAIEMSGFDPARASGYRRSLDLDSALAETCFTVDGVAYRREVIASPVDQIIAVRLSADKSCSITCRLTLSSPEQEAHTRAEGDDILVLSGRNDPHEGIAGALRFQGRLRAIRRGGSIAADGTSLIVTAADEVTLLIAMATSYRRFDDVSGDPIAIAGAQIARVLAKPFARIAADATAAHRRLFRRVAIDLGASAAAALPTDLRIRNSETAEDPALAALYFQYGRYLLIASSRPGGQAANLQGLWNDSPSPPWGSKYTININTEMNYWPAETMALPECVEPLRSKASAAAISTKR
jgi:alpha-L-fucosidase 2